MKRFLVFIISFIICVQSFGVGVFASETSAPVVSETNANLNELTITGKANAGDNIILTILYPERSLEQISSGEFIENSKIVAYTDVVTATDNTYTFVARLLDVPFCLGGEFKIVVNVNGNIQETTHNFYYFSKKQDIIGEFNTPPQNKTEAQILTEAIEIYGLKTNPLWTSGDFSKTLASFKNIKSDNGGAFEINPTKFAGFLEEAMLVSAVNSGKISLISTNGIIDNKLLGYFNSDASNDYINKIELSCRKNVVDSLVRGSYISMQDISDKFSELVAVNAIAHNVLGGYGHIETIISDYEQIFIDAGFKINEFKALNESKRNVFLSKFKEICTANIVDMKTQFNNTFQSLDKPSNGPSTGGFTGSTSSGGGKVSPTISGNDGVIPPVVIPPSPFKDMASYSWAGDAVSVLYNAGIISGYNSEEYAPGNNVTRAEFTKLVVSLINEDTNNVEKNKIKVAAVGDSLTYGAADNNGKLKGEYSYSHTLQNLLGDVYEVKNFGRASYGIYPNHKYPYYNTDEYKNSLTYKPDVVVSMFGTNDCKIQYWDEIKNDYKEIYKNFINSYKKDNPNVKIVICIPTPIFEADNNFKEERPDINSNEMREAVKKAAEELGAIVVDAYTPFINSSSDFPDGLHYNQKGASDFAKLVSESVLRFGENNAVTGDFSDVNVNDWYAPYITKAVSNGIVNGFGNSFMPNNNITREDAVVILYRFLSTKINFENEHYFDDESQISNYAQGPVAYMAGEKLVNGLGDGTFNAKGLLTRAEAAMLIYNAYKSLGTGVGTK